MDKPVLRADARRNRAKVLAAAEQAFAVDGLAVPLDEIARLAGVGAGTVYRHFPSKEALFQAVVLERVEQFAREARELLAAENPGAVFFDFFKRVVQQASLNRALCDALAETTGLGFKASAGSDFRSALQALLLRAQAAGAVREDIDGDDLRALIAGCLAAERYSPESRHLVRVVVDGLRKAG
ncbi:TetR/AcrR family transcriptional regulator [Amycolatopsis regifaucium]|uniref:TetR family transcriptional regulator n=1 Tax=Amycolatopsis regifaucium TaxID=546365 RepID=A0A154MB33_9PSEU|nr:TetR/AcrR family transcriptional regulator [Amycolatopsis regifaucium]KZB81736.1 TetR family transcriptional regulator [Amycolatopsis regifaucium]OKA06198.1 TetR family transcriptional regulator [Amycolatopsis regifaucium]SFG69758.1 DNA-binding transcriptional regulator, AcrR family [Amycolatopsis regifaucium]